MEFIDRDPINHLFWALAERLFKLLLSATIWDVLLCYVNYCTTGDKIVMILLMLRMVMSTIMGMAQGESGPLEAIGSPLL